MKFKMKSKILSRYPRLSWISSKIFPERARSWQDIQDVERCVANLTASNLLVPLCIAQQLKKFMAQRRAIRTL